jgi:hypothetical protein
MQEQNNLPQQQININSLDLLKIQKEIEVSKKFSDTIKNILAQNSVKINNQYYIRVTGWQTIARLFNISCVVRDVKKTENGYLSYAEAFKDNVIIGSAYGFAGFDEISNFKRERKEFELVSLSQTRAIARALKSIFSFTLGYLREFSYSAFEEIATVENEIIIGQDTNTKKQNDNKEINNNFDKSEVENYPNISFVIQDIVQKKFDREDIIEISKNLKNYAWFNSATEKQKKYLIDLINNELSK